MSGRSPIPLPSPHVTLHSASSSQLRYLLCVAEELLSQLPTEIIQRYTLLRDTVLRDAALLSEEPAVSTSDRESSALLQALESMLEHIRQSLLLLSSHSNPTRASLSSTEDALRKALEQRGPPLSQRLQRELLSCLPMKEPSGIPSLLEAVGEALERVETEVVEGLRREREVFETQQAILREKSNAIDRLHRENATLNENVRSLQAEGRSLREKIEELEKQSSGHGEDLEALRESERQAKDAELKRLTSQLRYAELESAKVVEGLKRETDRALKEQREREEDLRSEIKRLQEDLSDERKRRETLREEERLSSSKRTEELKEKYEKSLREERYRRKELQRSITEEYEKERRRLQDEVEEKFEKIRNNFRSLLKKKLGSRDDKLKDLQHENGLLRRQMDELKGEIDSLRDERKRNKRTTLTIQSVLDEYDDVAVELTKDLEESIDDLRKLVEGEDRQQVNLFCSSRKARSSPISRESKMY